LSVEKRANMVKLDEKRRAPNSRATLGNGQYHPFTYPSGIMYSMACGYMVHQCHTKPNYTLKQN